MIRLTSPFRAISTLLRPLVGGGPLPKQPVGEFLRMEVPRSIRNFKVQHPLFTGIMIGLSLPYVFSPMISDVVLPFYTDLLKPLLASGLHFLGIHYPSFHGDNAVSPFTNLQRAQDFYRESAQRERKISLEIQKLQTDLKESRRQACPDPGQKARLENPE